MASSTVKKYGPNGEYATLAEFFDANPSAKSAHDAAVEKAMNEAQSNSVMRGSTSSAYPTKISKFQASPIMKIQPKYGTSCVQFQPAYGTVPISQPAYGTVPISQPAYGTVPISQPVYQTVPISQPKYGTSCTTTTTYTDLNITYAQVQDNISKLKKAVSSLRSTWDEETKHNLTMINSSWAGDDCSAYTQKILKMDSKVQNTISALDLLRSTYEQAISQVQQSQQSSLSSINKLEG